MDHATPGQKNVNHAPLVEIAETPLGLITAERAAAVVRRIVGAEPGSVFVDVATFNSAI